MNLYNRTSKVVRTIGHDESSVMAHSERAMTVHGLTRSESYAVALDMAMHGEVDWVGYNPPVTPSNYYAAYVSWGVLVITGLILMG